jgi:GDP-4-dehydro-6-deoxy-D-mannose reductase
VSVKALVTGAAGFVGRYLVAHLERCGDEVVAATQANAPDLLDGDRWHGYLGAVRPDVVYHLAGRTSVAESWADPVRTFRVNAEGTLHLLGACRAAGVGRVLVVSSSDVYGPVSPEQLPLDERAALRPATPYAASKAAAEQVAVQAHLGYGLGTIRARAFNHTGPGQDARFVAPALAARVAEAEAEERSSIPVGDLTARRELLDVRDVVGAYRLLIERGQPGEVYNVCAGRDLPIAELAELFLRHARVPLELRTDPALLRPVEVPALRGSPARLQALTGWQPTIPLEDTVVALLDEARSRLSARAH